MMSENKIKIIAVVGPTASGKTSLALSLAEALDGEIISCDSMQIYKGMDIGTAKPTKEELERVPHHMIDTVSPDDDFSCADYKIKAKEAISDITSRGKIPIFCGGTGLYLDSVISVSDFSPSVDPSVREGLKQLSPEELWAELSLVDPEAAEKTHKNNVKRVMRALEIYRGTGRTKTEWDRLSKAEPAPYDCLIIGLDFHNRELLYERIEKRVDIMLDEGLLAEVLRLDLKRDCNAAQGIGYKEIYKYLDGEMTLDEAVLLLKKNTRHYAKRQLTWFKRNPDTMWFYGDSEGSEKNFENIVNIAKKHLTSAE